MNIKHLIFAIALTPLVAIGAPASAILGASLPDLNGQHHSIKEWNGKIRIVSFWATWCAPCRTEIPLLTSASEQYRNKGVEVIGVAVDQAEEVREYFKQVPAAYPMLLAPTEGQALMRSGGNTYASLPFTVLLDAQGAILQRHQGAVDAKLIKQWLAAALANRNNHSTTKGPT